MEPHKFISTFFATCVELAVKGTRLLGLVPSVLVEREIDISEAVEMYSQDLPCPKLVAEELKRWRHKFVSSTATDSLPNSCAEAIKVCDCDCFPNIIIHPVEDLLHIACHLLRMRKRKLYS